jgi:hypothetical protein
LGIEGILVNCHTVVASLLYCCHTVVARRKCSVNSWSRRNSRKSYC